RGGHPDTAGTAATPHDVSSPLTGHNPWYVRFPMSSWETWGACDGRGRAYAGQPQQRAASEAEQDADVAGRHPDRLGEPPQRLAHGVGVPARGGDRQRMPAVAD